VGIARHSGDINGHLPGRAIACQPSQQTKSEKHINGWMRLSDASRTKAFGPITVNAGFTWAFNSKKGALSAPGSGCGFPTDVVKQAESRTLTPNRRTSASRKPGWNATMQCSSAQLGFPPDESSCVHIRISTRQGKRRDAF
jgi:hypothetical protein